MRDGGSPALLSSGGAWVCACASPLAQINKAAAIHRQWCGDERKAGSTRIGFSGSGRDGHRGMVSSSAKSLWGSGRRRTHYADERSTPRKDRQGWVKKWFSRPPCLVHPVLG